MTQYANNGGDSNITAYENGNGYIKIQFASGKETLYTYTNTSAGSQAIHHMQSLAEAGQGLNSYISKNRPNFESKE